MNVAVYMDPGVICQGPTGTGTTALFAVLHQLGRVGAGATVRAVSPYGNEFTGTLTGTVPVGHTLGVETRISGRPRLLGRGRMIIDLDDPTVNAASIDSLLTTPVRPN